MKRLIVVLFVVGISFALGHLTRQTPVSALGGGAGESQSPCEADPTLYSIDANDNGRLNEVADATLLLRWIFLNQEPPRRCLGQELAQFESDLEAAQADLAQCQVDRDQAQADRDQAQEELAQCQMDRDQAQEALAQCEVDLDACLNPPPPGGTSKFRMISNLTCNNAPVTATVQFCGKSVDDTTDPGGLAPSDCVEAPAGSVCSVRVFFNIPCGNFELCGDVPVKRDHVYDFYMFFDASTSQPAVGWTEQALGAEGQCPLVPLIQPETRTDYDGSFELNCPGGAAGIGAALENGLGNG